MRNLITISFFLLCGVGLKAQKVHRVTTVDDMDDGVCNNIHCSLREAINASNTDGVSSVIWFEINGPGVKVITLDAELPTISDELKIDGTTLANNVPTKGRLILDGNDQIENGFQVASEEVEIYGFQFQSFLESAISLEGTNGSFMNKATIGMRRKGNIFIKNGNAVLARNVKGLFFQANYVGTNFDFEEGLGNKNGILLENNRLSAENSLLIIGGETDRLEHNYFASSSQAALSLSYQGIATIEGNVFGTGIEGNEDLGNKVAVQTTNERGRVDIGGSSDTRNIFAYNESGVIIADNNYVNISRNSFYCNGLGISVTRNTYPIPVITSGVETMLTGTSQPNDIIEVYFSDEPTCNSSECQGMIYVGTVTANGVGNWQFSGIFDFGQQIVALSRNSGRQSMFSQCFKICPANIQANATNDGPYCENDTIQLNANFEVFGYQWVTQFDEEDIIYDWEGPNGFKSNERNPKEIADGGKYFLQTYLLGCPSEIDSTMVDVTKISAAIADVPIACQADSITLNSITTSNIGSLEYHWSGPDGYTSNQKNSIDVTASGNYELYVTGDGCQSTVANITVTNHFPEPFSLGTETTICEGESFSLVAPDQPYFQWNSNLALTCDTCSTIELTPERSGTIQLLAGPTATCVAEASITVEVVEPINITEERILCPGSSLNIFTETIEQPGTYQAIFTSQSGCDSIHTFIVTESEVNEVFEVRTICEGEVVRQNGQTYTTSGVYETSFTTANGCDSTHILELEVLEKAFVTEAHTICAGESMLIFGTPVAESATISKVFTAANGCDSTHQISLLVNETYNESVTITLCAGETATLFEELEVGQNGFYQRDYTTTTGCDSVVMVEVVVLETIETFNHITMCEDEALALYGETSAFPGDYMETFTAQSGCDSINYVSYEIRSVQAVEEDITICGTESYLIGTDEITASGKYTYTYTAANGCDSTHITNLVVLDIPYGEESYALCAGESMEIFGDRIDAAGIYSAVLSNENGCDSFHTVTVSIKEALATNEVVTICEGESVMLFDQLVTSNDWVSRTFSGANGCDSTHTFQITMLEKIATESSLTICPSDCIELYGATACSDKIFQETFTANSGCDSTHTLLITTLEPQEVIQEYTLCSGDSMIVFDSFIKEEGTYSQVFSGANGCDSIQTFIIEEATGNRVFEAKTICEGETLNQFGQSFATTGMYEATFAAANGCDSVHVVELTVLTPTFVEETYELCAGESMLVFGETVRESGIVSKVFTASNGCDSTHTVTLVVKEQRSTNEVRTLCEGESMILFDKLVTSEEVLSRTFVSANGCDSTHTVEVVMLNNVQTEASTEICASACIELYGATACSDKVFQQTFTANSGCDSTHTLSLTILEPQEVIQSYTLCSGDSLEAFGSFIKEEGTYTQVFSGANGCDSIQTFIIETTTANRVFEAKTICEGETLNQFGQSFATTGMYEATFAAANGCDSIHVVELTVLTPTFAEETHELCAGESMLVFGERVTESAIVSKVFTASNGCDSTHTVTLSIKEAQSTNEVRTLCEGESMILFDKLVTSDDVVGKTFTSANGCDSTHTVQVVMLKSVQTEASIEICASACVELYGATACSDKIFQETFTANSGCDSTHTLLLKTTGPLATTESYTLCHGDSMEVFGDFIRTEGAFTQTYSSNNGCDSLHTITVEFTEEITTNIITSPSCLNSNGGSVEMAVTNGTNNHSIYWEGINMGNNLQLDNLEPGSYEVEISDELGCQWNQKVEIEAIPSPEIEKEILSITCFGANDGAVALFSNQAGLSYSLDGITYTKEADFVDLPPADYQVFIKDDSGCAYTEQFSLVEPAPLEVALPSEMTINLGASLQLVPMVNNQEGINYDWEVASSLSCLDCANPIAKPLEDTKYTLTIYNENNCEGTAEMWLRVDDNKDLYVPNVFSPDNSGQNDKFMILPGSDSPIQEVESLRIYDRWGNLIYEANNFDPLDENFAWNGRNKGEIMDNGVYIYSALVKFIDGTEELLKGDITLTR